MARVLKRFPKKPGEAKPKKKYPWDIWFDGQVWALNPSTDFPGVKKATYFQTQVNSAATKRGGTVQTMVIQKKIGKTKRFRTTLYLQFSPGEKPTK